MLQDVTALIKRWRSWKYFCFETSNTKRKLKRGCALGAPLHLQKPWRSFMFTSFCSSTAIITEPTLIKESVVVNLGWGGVGWGGVGWGGGRVGVGWVLKIVEKLLQKEKVAGMQFVSIASVVCISK